MRQSLPFLFAISVTACGAESPTPPSSNDAGLTDGALADLYLAPCVVGRPCGSPHYVCVAGACRPVLPEHCGERNRACPAGQVCWSGSDGDGGDQVYCAAP